MKSNLHMKERKKGFKLMIIWLNSVFPNTGVRACSNHKHANIDTRKNCFPLISVIVFSLKLL